MKQVSGVQLLSVGGVDRVDYTWMEIDDSTGDIISIITNKDGLDTSHVGIVFWDQGKLHLMHASSLQKKVVMDEKTFYDYSQAQKSHLGIRVYRPL